MKLIGKLLKFGFYLALLGVLIFAAVIYHFTRDLPNHQQLIDYNPDSVSRIYSFDGELLEEYAREYRIFVPLSSIPYSVREAFIAAEDKNFYSHPGFDVKSIIKAFLRDMKGLWGNKRLSGGSTITQQVVKNFLLTNERSINRKIKEAILAYVVTNFYSKDKILELYLNQIFLGKRAYGVASAALIYFNKSIDELKLEEAAFLAGLPKAPSHFNPHRNYTKALERRNYVLGRMHDLGLISKTIYEQAKATQLGITKTQLKQNISANYYSEEVRRQLVEMYGEDYLYSGGITVITCLRPTLQKQLEDAFRQAIRDYDRRYGYRGPIDTIQDLPKTHEEIAELAGGYKNYPGTKHFTPAVVTQITSEKAKITFDDGKISYIPIEGMRWAKNNLQEVSEVLTSGDVVLVQKHYKNNYYMLRQFPEVNGASMAMNPHTGQVSAMIGGYESKMHSFNRATQASRQPGSAFKPVVYLEALRRGIEPNTIFDDLPISLEVGPHQELWEPKNYNEIYEGPVSMSYGFAKSKNAVTVRVAEQAGLNNISKLAESLGISSYVPPLYSMSLGSLETSLDRMTNAYCIMVNGGKKVSPQFIEAVYDRRGRLIYKRETAECPDCNLDEDNYDKAKIPNPDITPSEQIIDPEHAYQISYMMQNSVKYGTSRKARILEEENIGGKTGTTNNSNDAWFIGFSNNLVVGTYIGHDRPKDLGKYATGASVALPVFINFMQEYLRSNKVYPLKVPYNIEFKKIDPITGLNSDKIDAEFMPIINTKDASFQ